MIPVLHGVWAAAGGLVGDFEHIETQTVGAGGASSITFSSIPGTYKHLELRGIAAATFSAPDRDGLYMRFNSDSGSNYVRHGLSGNGATATSFANTSQTWVPAAIVRLNSSADSIFGAGITQILDYASTSKNKTIRCLPGLDLNGSGETGLFSGLWLNSGTAITSITLLYPSQTLRQYTSFSLYGVK